MLRKIVLAMMICFAALPQAASYAYGGGFIDVDEGRAITRDFRWKVRITKLAEDKKPGKVLYEADLDKPIIQKGSGYLSFSDCVTVLEPMPKTSSDIILRIDDVDIDGSNHSETFIFEKNARQFYAHVNEDKQFRIELFLRPLRNGVNGKIYNDIFF